MSPNCILSPIMKRLPLIVCLGFAALCNAQTYHTYHQQVIRSEELISEKKIGEARQSLDSLFQAYDFVFLREYQLATELSLYQEDYDAAFELLRLGVLNGWSMQSMKKSKSLKPLRKDPRWDTLTSDYDSLREVYKAKLKIELRKEAHEMLKGDQKIALKVFLIIGEKSKTKYASKKFKPYSEEVMTRLYAILDEHGYPGEKLIGNSWWTSVNLSHHNSFDREYTLKDTLYVNLRPKLEKALQKGELHPKDYAIMEDWRNATLTGHETSLYGFLGKIPDDSTLAKVNENRAKLGLKSIQLRNQLLTIEKESGLNLHLPKGWQKGEIVVNSK